MFFLMQSDDSFNFPLGLIKYIVTVVIVKPDLVARPDPVPGTF